MTKPLTETALKKELVVMYVNSRKRFWLSAAGVTESRRIVAWMPLLKVKELCPR